MTSKLNGNFKEFSAKYHRDRSLPESNRFHSVDRLQAGGGGGGSHVITGSEDTSRNLITKSETL